MIMEVTATFTISLNRTIMELKLLSHSTKRVISYVS